MMSSKAGSTESVPASVEEGLKKVGILSFHGRAHFVDRSTIQVGDDTLSAGKVVIAAGARRATLGLKGEEHLTSTTDFLQLHELPRRGVFVGGRYLHFELAHVLLPPGAQVQ